MTPTTLDREFNPVWYSLAENRFLIDHAGKPPVVVFRTPMPPGVNPRAIRPVIERIYELMELETHEHLPWVGLDAIRQAIQTYLTQYAAWQAGAKRARGVRWPSLYLTDQGGRRVRYGVGSDSGTVRSFIDDQGQRQPFAIDLTRSAELPEEPIDRPSNLPVELEDDQTHGVLTCPACRFSVNYKAESAGSKNLARARMGKHLRAPATEPDWHRLILTHEFPSGQ